MEAWHTWLLNPATAPNTRATALHNLPVDSPWRQAVLRYDVRLWELFPAECALFTMEAEDDRGHTSNSGGCGSDSDSHASSPMEHVQQPASIPQLHPLAADVCPCLATYASASSAAAASACTDVSTKEHVMQALAQEPAMLRQLDAAAVKQEEATLALELARMQHQAIQELSHVVRQAGDDVVTAVVNVKAAVDSGSRDEVDSAVQQRCTVRGMAVDNVRAASRKCVECGMDAKYLEESPIGSLARTFLDKMENDADTDATTGTLVQV